ncbi:MAG: histidine kinase [Humibacter sp.]
MTAATVATGPATGTSGAIRLFALIAAPVVGALYLVLWILAETGRYPVGGKIVVFALLAVAIGVSGWRPYYGLGLMVLVPLLQLIGVVWPAESTTWPMYEAFAIVGFFAGVQRSLTRWWVVLCAGLTATVLAAVDMVFPHYLWGAWPSVGALFDPSFGWVSWIGSSIVFRTSELYWADPRVLGVLAWYVSLLVIVGMLAFAIAWGAGTAISLTGVERAGAVMRTRWRRTDVELRLEQQRSAIAREVHDTLAHSLAVVVAQAEGGVAVASGDPERAAQSLRVIADVSRTALVECRTLVERIHDPVPDAPADYLAAGDLREMIDRMRALGMVVDYRVLGEERELPAARRSAYFRIVQESLTNALKHGGPDAEVTITADWRGDGLALLIGSRGTAEKGAIAGGAGIAGMRERARLAGGWLTAGRADDGAFLVTAFIPVSPAETVREEVGA